MRKKGLFIVIVLFSVFQHSIFGQNGFKLSELQITLLIDSLENLLPDASLKEKAVLYDSLGDLSANISTERSLYYYMELFKLPDTVTGVDLKVSVAKKVAGIYYKLNDLEKANKYLMIFDQQLKKLPQATGEQFLHSMHEKANRTEEERFFISWGDIFILILVLIFVSVFYLWQLHNKFVAVRKKKLLFQREVEIINNKNREVEEELEKIIQNKTSVEEEKVDKIRKKHLKLRKELNNLEEGLYKRRAFLSGLGPDLRTALNSIMGFALELKNEVRVLNNSALNNNARELFLKISQLDIILENVVDMASSNINALGYSIQSVSVQEIFSSIIRFFNNLYDDNRVVIKTSVLQGIPNVKADKDKLLRVLKELVFSISSGVEEGIIEIGAGQVNKSSEIVFIISYSEEDFSSSKLELLNAVLATDYGLNDDENSSSIGLSAANDLISGMNGHIKVNRQKGNKNSISIYLPVAKESKEPDEIKQQAAELVTGGDSEIDIFLVEDDRMNRMVIETMLKHTGKVTTAVDGEETLQIIEEYHKSGKVFDIMLFDINLPPPWDGVILMQKIREDYPEYRDIPFVAQTAYAMDSDRDRFLNAGFDDYLTKPINKSELITIIHHQLELFKNRNKK